MRAKLRHAVAQAVFWTGAFASAVQADECIGEFTSSRQQNMLDGLFVVAADVTAEKAQFAANPEATSFADDRLGLHVGNAFLIAKTGSIGYLVTARHVVRQICSGMLSNSDRTIKVIWPQGRLSATTAEVVAPQLTSPNGDQLCSSRVPLTTGAGADIAILKVDLKTLPDFPITTAPIPIATKQDDYFTKYSVQGYEPSGILQRIVGTRGDAPEFRERNQVVSPHLFTIGTPAQHGYSGAAVIGYTPSDGFAVTGILTDLYPHYQTVQLERPNANLARGELPSEIAQVLQINERMKAIFLDLAVLQSVLPDLPSTENIDGVTGLAQATDSLSNRRRLQQLTRQLTTMEQAALAKKYSNSQQSPQIWFLGEMFISERQWCWNARAFEVQLYSQVERAKRNPAGSLPLVQEGEKTLRSLNAQIDKSPRTVAMLEFASATLSIPASLSSGASRPSWLTPAAVKTLAVDEATARIKLVQAQESPALLDLAEQSVQRAQALAPENTALLKSAADVNLQASSWTNNPQAKATYVAKAMNGYDALLSRNDLSASDKAAVTTARDRGITLARQLGSPASGSLTPSGGASRSGTFAPPVTTAPLQPGSPTRTTPGTAPFAGGAVEGDPSRTEPFRTAPLVRGAPSATVPFTDRSTRTSPAVKSTPSRTAPVTSGRATKAAPSATTPLSRRAVPISPDRATDNVR